MDEAGGLEGDVKIGSIVGTTLLKGKTAIHI
jgi:hypothetical protein